MKLILKAILYPIMMAFLFLSSFSYGIKKGSQAFLEMWYS